MQINPVTSLIDEIQTYLEHSQIVELPSPAYFYLTSETEPELASAIRLAVDYGFFPEILFLQDTGEIVLQISEKKR